MEELGSNLVLFLHVSKFLLYIFSTHFFYFILGNSKKNPFSVLLSSQTFAGTTPLSRCSTNSKVRGFARPLTGYYICLSMDPKEVGILLNKPQVRNKCVFSLFLSIARFLVPNIPCRHSLFMRSSIGVEVDRRCQVWEKYCNFLARAQETDKNRKTRF